MKDWTRSLVTGGNGLKMDRLQDDLGVHWGGDRSRFRFRFLLKNFWNFFLLLHAAILGKRFQFWIKRVCFFLCSTRNSLFTLSQGYTFVIRCYKSTLIVVYTYLRSFGLTSTLTFFNYIMVLTFVSIISTEIYICLQWGSNTT